MKPALLIVGLIGIIAIGVAVFHTPQQDEEELGLSANRLTASFFNNLSTRQQAALTKYGNYLSKSRESQVNIGGTPVTDFNGLTIPDNLEIQAYDGPMGKTYQVILTTATTTQSWAFGADPALVAAKTYLITGQEHDSQIASSTP